LCGVASTNAAASNNPPLGCKLSMCVSRGCYPLWRSVPRVLKRPCKTTANNGRNSSKEARKRPNTSGWHVERIHVIKHGKSKNKAPCPSTWQVDRKRANDSHIFVCDHVCIDSSSLIFPSHEAEPNSSTCQKMFLWGTLRHQMRLSAYSMSAIKSSGDSKPMESLITSSPAPDAALCSSVNCRCVVDAGWRMSDRESPTLAK